MAVGAEARTSAALWRGKDPIVEFEQQSLEPDPVIEAYKKDVDRTLIRENLGLTVEQRFLRLMELQRFAEALREAGRRASKPP